MIPKNRIPTHPGEILLRDFLEPSNMPQLRFASYLKVPVQRINEIIKGKRGITPDTAWLFSQSLGTTPEFWVNLQTNYDLAKNRPTVSIKKLQLKAA